MRARHFLSRAWGQLLFLAIASTLAGLFFATQFYYVMKAWGTPVHWDWVIAVRLWAWYEWGALALLVLWLSRRFPLKKGHLRVSLPAHLVASVAIAALQIAINTWTHLAFVADPSLGHTYLGYLQSLMMFGFHRNLLIYWILVGGSHALRTYRELKETQIQTSELKAQLAEARLHALKMQLHPHFLFNTLNAISALTRKDPAGADRLINDLSELLRLVLTDVEAQTVPLVREVEFLERYLDIQEVRFGSRLRASTAIEPETLCALVPNLLLQPVVENAVQYAVASRYDGGRIEIRARREGDRLRVAVEDDGPGLAIPAESALRAGIGLSSTKERLETLYGQDASLVLEPSSLGGLAVRFDLPFRPVELDREDPDLGGLRQRNAA